MFAALEANISQRLVKLHSERLLSSLRWFSKAAKFLLPFVVRKSTLPHISLQYYFGLICLIPIYTAPELSEMRNDLVVKKFVAKPFNMELNQRSLRSRKTNPPVSSPKGCPNFRPFGSESRKPLMTILRQRWLKDPPPSKWFNLSLVNKIAEADLALVRLTGCNLDWRIPAERHPVDGCRKRRKKLKIGRKFHSESLVQVITFWSKL